MSYLLDTHVFLSIVWGSTLSQTVRDIYLDPDNSVFLSAASYWEISIKISIGKLRVTDNWQTRFDNEIAASRIQWLPISKTHCRRVTVLPWHHNDPFDRMLVAQALDEDMILLTSDANIRKYAAFTLW